MPIPYETGLCDIGSDIYAYLQADGSWGWSNAGLVVDGDQALLVDTLFDEKLTATMLAQIQGVTGLGARDIATVVNTHANGDHTHGNGLLPEAEIVASRASAEEMQEVTPELLAQMLQMAPELGEAGAYLTEIFGAFDFAGVNSRLPTRTFETDCELKVGNKTVSLTNVGPAHTRGDVLVHVPDDRVIFTGDILFIDGTPIMWQGPVSNWIRACDHILGLDVDVIVPGHGPVTDKNGVRAVRSYLGYVDQEARARFDAGLSVEDAAMDIALGDYDSWLDAERIVVNVDTLYREYSGSSGATDIVTLFTQMARIRADRKGRA